MKKIVAITINSAACGLFGKRGYLATILLILASASVFAAATRTIELSPADSLPAVVATARKLHRHGTNHVRLILHGGTYVLDHPLVLTPADSGLTVEAFWHDAPVISGQTQLHGWRLSAENPNVVQTTLKDVRKGHWVFHSLFVNGERKSRTRLPETGYYQVAVPPDKKSPADFIFRPGEIQSSWAKTPDVEIVVYQAWAQSRNQISQVFGADHRVSLAGSAMPNYSEKLPRFYVENAPVPLRPGQWRVDLASGILSYWPDAGEDIRSAVVTAPHLYDLVEIKGQPDQPAHDIVFKGITFADTDWPLNGGSDLDEQAAVERGSAVHAEFAHDCTFENCTFTRLGGYALQLGKGCQRDKVIGNEMFDLGAGGIRVGETTFPDTTNEICGHHWITDNHVHDIGLVDAPAVGIFILLSDHNEIAHNEVDHTFYTAISDGWSWGYLPNPCHDNVIEFNHLHDIGQGRLSDMGGVYTLGVQPGTIVRNNLIHDVNRYIYGAWGLYTDEGSSGILLENNVVYHCQSAGFHQHYGETNIIRNNIFAFNREFQLMRTRIEKHVAFIFTNNIVYFDSGKLLGGNWGDDLVMDHNIYFDTRATPSDNQQRKMIRRWEKRGHDIHSLVVDPAFVNPRRFNFHLRPWSPARRMGFKPIDLHNVGMRWPYRHKRGTTGVKSLTEGAAINAY